MGNLMTIGEFSCRSGLSAKVLRATSVTTNTSGATAKKGAAKKAAVERSAKVQTMRAAAKR